MTFPPAGFFLFAHPSLQSVFLTWARDISVRFKEPHFVCWLPDIIWKTCRKKQESYCRFHDTRKHRNATLKGQCQEDSLVLSPPPPGGESIRFYTGTLRPEVHTLPFNRLFFTKMVLPSYTYSKIAALSYTSRISQNNRISYNCLVQLLKGCKLLWVLALSFLPKCGTLWYSSH